MANKIVAKFFKIAKKPNSTGYPVEQPSTMLERSVEIIEPFDLLNPTIKVVDCWTDAIKDTWTYFMQFNYVKLGKTDGDGREIDRYYWIKNWRRQGGVCFAECEVDVLASWRGTILSSKQLVERCSATNEYDGTLVDVLRPKKNKKTSGSLIVQDTVNNLGWHKTDSFVVVAFPKNHDKNVFIAGSEAAFNDYVNQLSTSLVEPKNISAVGETEYISTGRSVSDFTAAYYSLPYTWSTAKMDTQNFDFGIGETVNNEFVPKKNGGGAVRITPGGFKYATGISNSLVVYSGKVGLENFWYTGDSAWANTSDYLSVTITFKPFGTIDIPISYLLGHSTLNIEVIGDIQGNMVLYCYVDNDKSQSKILGVAAGVVSRPNALIAPTANDAKISQIKAEGIAKTVTAGIVFAASAAAAATGVGVPAILSVAGGLAGFVSTGYSNAVSTANAISSAMYPEGIISNGMSGTLIIDTKPTVSYIKFGLEDAQTDIYGRPLHGLRTLNSLIRVGNSGDKNYHSGYVQCSNANIDNEVCTDRARGNSTMTITEKIAICNFLNGGVYLE